MFSFMFYTILVLERKKKSLEVGTFNFSSTESLVFAHSSLYCVLCIIHSFLIIFSFIFVVADDDLKSSSIFSQFSPFIQINFGSS